METFDSQLVKAMLWLERYEPKALIGIEDKLLIAQKNILNFIATTQNQRKIRAYIKSELTLAFGTFNQDILNDIEEVSGLSYDKVGAIVTSGFVTDNIAKSFKNFKSIEKGVKDNLLSPNRLILGNNIDDLKNQMILGANNKLRSTILQGFNDGSGIDTINREVKTIVGNLTKNQAKTVTRTVLLNAIEEAKNVSLEFFEDEIDYWVYSSILDTRTSLYCRNASGYKTKDKATAKYKVKSHWNCRSMWTIENEFTREMDAIEKDRNIVAWSGKKVNSRDGTTYTKFKVDNIKSIPKNASGWEAFDYFDEADKLAYLGKTRYNLYASGKATLKEMADISRNRFVPLDTLKKKLNIN